MVVGTAERALLTRHRTIAEDVRQVIGSEGALAPSGSAFRLVHDPAVGRDVIDSSALAAADGVLRRAIEEQPLQVSWPDGAEPGPEPVADDRGRLQEMMRIRSAPRTPAAAVHAAVGTLTTVATRAETLLVVPARVAGWERAELACRAYGHGWFEEAERLFLDATERLPTEPYLWFGAGLSAGAVSMERATSHLARAARYLHSIDEGAAAYVHIVAAAILEDGGANDAAIRHLEEARVELGRPCPALLLHLARLAPGEPSHLRAAIDVDPLLEADVAAIGLVDTDAVLIDRRRQTERELEWLEFSMAQMRRVDEGPGWVDPVSTASPPPPGQRLPLTRLEIELWTKLRRCEHEVRLARGAVTAREEARRAKEVEISRATEEAAGDLGYQQAFPVFIAGVLVAVGLVASFVLEGVVDRLVPAPSPVVGIWLALARLGMVAFFVWLLVYEAWPRRRFVRARRAKQELPRLEWQAARLRQSEFEARRRFNQANQAAELRIRRIVDRRRQLVPRRPRFGADADAAPATGPPVTATAGGPAPR